MIDPVLIMGCGHSACNGCEGRLTSKNCPECGTAYQGVSHNIALKKSASNLKFRCEHCKLEGKMGCVKQHLSVCPKYPENCRECKGMYTRDQAKEHEETCSGGGGYIGMIGMLVVYFGGQNRRFGVI